MLQFNKSILSALAVIVLLISSCEQSSNENLYDVSSSIKTRSIIKEFDTNSYVVTQQMAELFISSNKNNPPIINIEPYYKDDITCFYIINFEKGYKVISADTRVQPILAESNEDHLFPDENNNEGIKTWLEDTANRITMLKSYSFETGQDYSEMWSILRAPALSRDNNRNYDVDSIWVLIYDSSYEEIYNHADIGPLLYTKWGQGSPWYNKMPKDNNNTSCLTGCVAVATSQVLYYFNRTSTYPNDLWHTITIQSTSTCPVHGGLLATLSKSSYTNHSSRWAQMPLDKNGSNTDYVSYLMLDVGVRLDMHYGTISSGVYHANDLSIPNLSSCGISYSFSSFSFANVENSILQGKPVIVSAWLNPSRTSGHTWVIDGCRDYSTRFSSSLTYYCIHPDELINYPNNSGVLSYDEMMSLYPEASGGIYRLNYSVNYDNQQSLHMNWGWDGDGDSWYNLLDSNNWTYTNPSGNSLNFLYDRVIHYNISTTQLY